MNKRIITGLFLVLLIMATNSWAVLVSVRVTGTNNDVEGQIPPDNYPSMSSPDLEIGYDGGTRQHIGMRFQSLAIPNGATINSAYIEFEVDETDSGTTDVIIYGQDDDDANEFGNGANNISNRTRTSASVNWSIPAWNTVSQKQQSPDITSIIQEIINRAGWVSGNDLAVIVEPGAGCGSSSCQRTAESVDGESANAPLLVIDYTVAGGSPSCDIFSDDFSSGNYSGGTANWLTDWVEDDDGRATNGDVRITDGRLMLRDDGSSIYRGVNLSAYSSATLTFDYEESSLDSSSEYADLEIRTGGSGAWTFVQRFAGDPNDSGSVSIPVSSYLNANTQIRFVTPNGGMSNDDLFYVDNVQIEACTTTSLSPVADYYLDEAAWTGSTGEAVDNTGNGFDGTSFGAVSAVPGKICNGMDISANTSAIVQSGFDSNVDINDDVGNVGSISLWYRSNSDWIGGGEKTLLDASPDYVSAAIQYFTLIINNNGELRFNVEDLSDGDFQFGTGQQSFLADEWVHIIVTWNMYGDREIYINGILDTTDARIPNQPIGQLSTLYIGDNRSSNVPPSIGSNNSANGVIDEVIIFNQVLSSADVTSIYTNQSDNKNYDGSSRACLDTPLVEWRFDESGWSGTSGEVIDAQGAFNATAVNGATTGGSAPALAGDPGTCRYGTFDGSDDYVDLSGMSELTGSFTITAWIYANETGNDQRIFVDDQNNSNGFALTLGDGGNGRLRFFSRNVNPIIVDTQNEEILPGNWYHVAAVHDLSAKTRQIYVNGTAVQLNTGSASSIYTGTWGFDPGVASIGGENSSAGGEANANFRFNGNIDEVRVYEAPLSASQITTVMNETRPCTATSVDHFNINVGAGAASTCSAFEFTVTAEDSSNNPITDYSGSVSITTSTSHGNFATVTAENNNTPDPDVDDNGSAGYTFDALDNGDITLGLSNEHAETLSISVVDNSVASSLSTSSNVTFSDNAFVITDADTTLTGADNIPVAGRDHDYLVQMIRRDPGTGSCGVATAYAGVKPLKMWRTRNGSDPGTLQPVLGGDSLPDAAPVITNGAITFTAGAATVQLQTSDIGRYTLELADISNTFSDTTIAGSSIEQIVRPFGLGIDFGTNLRDADFANGGLNGSNGDLSFALGNDLTGDDGSLFTQAGNSFVTTIEGVLWQAEDDTDDNGEPDAGSYLGNNTPAPSFGQEGETVTASASNPVPGSLGNLAGTLFNTFVGGSQSQNMSYDNVGIFDLSAALTDGDYWGSGVNITGSAPNVGRFNPHHYTVTAAIVNDACGSFTYAGQTFDANVTLEAQNLGNTRTDGYQGGYATLDIATELNVQNGATNADFDSEVYIINESFSAGTMGLAQFDIDLSWDMPEQAETSSAVQILDSSDEVTLVSPSPTSVGSTNIRFGRLWLGNVFGSELIALTMPMRTQYFDGSNYILNTDDSCTTVDHTVANELGVTPSPIGLTSTVTVISTTAVAGVLDVSLTAPGADNTGFFDVVPDLSISGETWLQYDWDSTIPGLENPKGRANFGIYNGDARQIYIRQIY